jgi:hypothetical protein
VAHAQQPGAGKLIKVAEGGKLHRRGGKAHFPHELYINMLARESECNTTSPSVLGKENACNSGSRARENPK